MSKLTYTAHAERGQGMALSPRVEIVHGWEGIVRRGDKRIASSGLFCSQAAAMRWATAKAQEFRAYRAKHSEGQEDVWDRQRAVKKAESRRWERVSQKRRDTYALMQTIVSDLELVREWLPTQALGRIDQARALIAFVETDPPQA